jgi:hypothetical protein
MMPEFDHFQIFKSIPLSAHLKSAHQKTFRENKQGYYPNWGGWKITAAGVGGRLLS